MTVDNGPREGSLVLYKGRAARVTRASDKVELEIMGGETQKVRPKDVIVLHVGPLRALADLRPQEGEVMAAWELLAGGSTTLGGINFDQAPRNIFFFQECGKITRTFAPGVTEYCNGFHFQGLPTK